MKRNFQNINNKIWPIISLLLLLVIWQLVSTMEVVPKYMLPSPIEVISALISEFPLLMSHAKVTLTEAAVGLSCGIILSFIMSILMDNFKRLYQAFYPLIVITQTIPIIAIAPLLVLWFGYDMLPKIILIVVMTFFPITIGLLNGFKAADRDTIRLLQSMKANKFQIFRYVKLPVSLPYFFAGLRISAAYSIVGAVISEWLGGFEGLGVYMIRVHKAFAFDKMFAVIFLISILSLLLIKLVDILQKKCMPWENIN